MPIVYTHTNLISRDWRRLADFYQKVLDCVPVPPERDISGEWLEKATGVPNAHITGVHLRLPGHGDNGPTLEIFQYDPSPEHPEIRPNTPGFSHLAFSADDVEATVQVILNNGGSLVGEMAVRTVPGVGLLSFRYVTDPEGNILEIQNWKKIEGLPEQS